ncbi:MAG: RRXRR domain-containing protein, partial [Desulfovibrionaceae bacterium]|nr:RRXRR domain-containing protein [Desulfovibrionaceae bacterium]
PGRENVGVALVLPHKNDQPETILRVHLETKNKEVKRHMTERSLHRAECRRYSREKRNRRAIKCNTTLEAPLTRKYPGYDKGEITVKVIRNKEPRFMNRVRPDGWITPTVRQLIQCTCGLVERLAKYFPIKTVVFEMPKFAFMRLEDGSVLGTDFQNGRMKGYANTKEYVRARDKGVCVNCAKPAEDVHHLTKRSRNGSDLPENLVCLCHECHTELHTGKLSKSSLYQGLFKKYHHLSVLHVAAPYIFKRLQTKFGEDMCLMLVAMILQGLGIFTMFKKIIV